MFLSYVSKDCTGRTFARILCEEQSVVDTVLHGVNSFGFLIKNSERIDPDEFANRISSVYDENQPQVKDVLASLHNLH